VGLVLVPLAICITIVGTFPKDGEAPIFKWEPAKSRFPHSRRKGICFAKESLYIEAKSIARVTTLTSRFKRKQKKELWIYVTKFVFVCHRAKVSFGIGCARVELLRMLCAVRSE
jgi:hypothetical protein